MKWVCVHGHFYQPPRENPWLEAIEPQPSAHPYPDWNARITAECYRPNAAARIVDGQGRIAQIVDNYARMSFDVGPTLMSWFEREAPDVHKALVDADHKSRVHFGGHGSAMAQAYNHMIMPLASPRDRVTQARWGVADFRYRFGRAPEAMWLPECAVDTASLEALAAEGIELTVLAPHQAKRIRPFGGKWQDAAGALDTGRVYRCELPSGRAIDLVFYDGATSQAIAFDRLLADGNALVARLIARDGKDVLCHVATDGETYGHHHRYGDMGLAWALETIDRGERAGARLTNYGEFRARHPATWEVEIVENSSWSCAHGVERWRADCGCSSGAHPDWKQAWRRPLREALDWLRDRAADVFERVGARHFEDPWAARDAYIEVILGIRPREGEVEALELLEMQRNAMLMYTSCGWFFDDLSGIETVQVLAYAARVCELAEKLGGEPVEERFVERLAAARSNLEKHGDGRAVWRDLVVPSRMTLEKVMSHWAVSAAIGVPRDVYCYEVAAEDLVERRDGKARLVAGLARCRSKITHDSARFVFAAMHLGEHHVIGGVRRHDGHDWKAPLDGLTREAIEQYFAGSTFSLGSLFRREQERALAHILDVSLQGAEEAYRRIYEEHAPLMRFLVEVGIPVPETLADAASLVLRHRIIAELRRPEPRYEEVRACIFEAEQVRADLDTPEVAYLAGEALRRMVDRLAATHDVEMLEQLAKMAGVAARMESRVDLWHTQNACVELREKRLPEWRRRGEERTIAAFARLCAAVHVYVEP